MYQEPWCDFDNLHSRIVQNISHRVQNVQKLTNQDSMANGDLINFCSQNAFFMKVIDNLELIRRELRIGRHHTLNLLHVFACITHYFKRKP